MEIFNSSSSHSSSNHQPPTMLICGTGSFSRVEEEEEESWPKSKKMTKRKKEIGKNPYSGRGLDKFSMVMSELETRKQKIMAGAESQAISLVGFTYSDSVNGWIPIIMKVPKTRQDEPNKFQLKSNASKERLQKEPTSDHTPTISKRPSLDKRKSVSVKLKGEEKRVGRWCWLENNTTFCYWSSVLLLILLCLLIDGRMLAVCCTSAWWYLVPIIRGKKTMNSLGGRKSMKMKDYKRKISNKKLGRDDVLVSPQ